MDCSNRLKLAKCLSVALLLASAALALSACSPVMPVVRPQVLRPDPELMRPAPTQYLLDEKDQRKEAKTPHSTNAQ